MTDLNKMVAGPAATSAQTINALLDAQVLLQQLNNECNQDTAKTWSQAALGSANATYDSTNDQAMATLSQGIGSLVGSVGSGGIQLAGHYTGDIGDKIQEKNTQLNNLKDYEESLGDEASIAMSRGNKLPSENDQAVSPTSKNLLEKLQSREAMKNPLSEEDRVSLQTLTQDERQKARKIITTEKKELNKEIESLNMQRSNRISQFGNLAQVVNGVTQGSGQVGASTHQMDQAAKDRTKTLLQYVDQALQSMMQQFDKTIDTAKQGISAAIQLDQGLMQANSRA